ncbi:MAG: hypothetical protein ACRD6X_15840 [Pyrinomonadaceae bacterium]
MKKTFLLWTIPAALLVFVLNLVGHFLYVVFYSYVISPGQEFVSYERHALVSAPYVTFVIGFVSMLCVSRWVSKRATANYRLVSAMLVPLLYSLIDISIVIYLKEYSSIPLLFAISYAPYFIAAYVGAGWTKRPEKPIEEPNPESTDQITSI